MMPATRQRSTRTTTTRVERTAASEGSGRAVREERTIESSNKIESDRSRRTIRVSEASYRSRSPLSITREEEKEELAGLNDRFVSYIEYVRQLSIENAEISKRFKSISQTEVVDTEIIKGMFENEMESLRKALDEMAKERAELDVENRKMRAEWDEMKAKLSRKEVEIRGLERKIEQLERDFAESRLDRERYLSIKREYDQELKVSGDIKKALEDETVLRNEYETKVNSLKMELDFLKNLHREEKSKYNARLLEIEEDVENRTKVDYDTRLADEIQLMREQTADEMRAYKMEIENTFNTKFASMKASTDRSTGDVVRVRDELYTLRTRFDEVNSELAKKEAELAAMLRRVGELEKMVDKERSEFQIQTEMYRAENATLRTEMEKRFKEFNDLLAVKIQLDEEILVYRKLLESEEVRCNLSETHLNRSSAVVVDEEEEMIEPELASNEGASSTADMRATYSVNTTNTGSIDVKNCDVGHSVTLRNLSNEDCVIGGWQLHYDADGKETVYKFPRNLTVRPNDTCTVWSSETHTTHDPPHDIVMKGLTFFMGNKINVTLQNKDEEVMAECTMERDYTRRTTTYSTRRVTTGRRGRAGSEERCSLM